MKKGFVLISILILSTLLLLFASGFVFSMVAEKRISNSQVKGTMAYYLAEAGINKAIWKLKNDSEWKSNFENDPNWSVEFIENDVLFPGDSFQVQIQNTGLAKGEITSTGLIESSQRIVKTKVFKAINPNSPLKAIFSDEDLSSSGTTITINPGSAFTNDDFNILTYSNFNIENKASAVDQIRVDWLSSLNAAIIEAENYPPAPEPIQMPMIDFDSDDLNSYKNRANQIYDSNEFRDMLRDNPNLVINGITYVTGKVKIRKGQHLTVNGVLVTDGNIEIGTDWEDYGQAQVTVNYTEGQPAGLLTKSRVWVGNWAGNLIIQGLVYANDRIDITRTNPGFSINLEGGIIVREFNTFSFRGTLNIIYNESIIINTLSQPQFSPVVTVEHWEEEY